MKKLLVTIKCKRTFCFEQEVEMTESDFDVIKDIDFDDIHEIRDRKEFSIIENHINTLDIMDAHDEWEDVQVFLEREIEG